MNANNLSLYHKYHLDRSDERFEMFEHLANHFNIDSVLYPGSFVHTTPSFVFSNATYVDADKRAKQFFARPELAKFVAQRQVYPQEAQIQFHHQDYTKPLPELDESFALLVSQYGGFVSQHCKRYLKVGGWLLANNSHGDASMASLDEDYQLVGVMKRQGEKFQFGTKNLDCYFVPKKDAPITKETLESSQRGPAYQKPAFAYVFMRTK